LKILVIGSSPWGQNVIAALSQNRGTPLVFESAAARKVQTAHLTGFQSWNPNGGIYIASRPGVQRKIGEYLSEIRNVQTVLFEKQFLVHNVELPNKRTFIKTQAASSKIATDMVRALKAKIHDLSNIEFIWTS
jgi:hypothetical protein